MSCELQVEPLERTFFIEQESIFEKECQEQTNADIKCPTH